MEDRVKLTADDSDYTAVMRRAGNTAEQFSSRVERANKRFTSLFKRDPGQRAETALSGLISGVATGDLTTGITGFLSRLSGIGLVAGVAVGAGITVFQKFKKQIDDTREAADALQDAMRSKPLSLVSKLSDEEMGQALEERQKLAANLREKAKHTTGSEIFETFADMVMVAFGGLAKIGDGGKERLENQKSENQANAEAKQIMIDRVVLAEKLLGIRRQELEGDERQAAIGKIGLQTERALADLRLKKLPHAAEARQEKVILENEELSLHQIDKKANAKEAEMKMAEKIAALQRKGLAGDDLKRVRAGLEIKRLDEEIAAEKSPQAKRALQLERAQKVNEAHGLLAPAGPSNPFPFGTAASRGFEREFGYGGFTKRGIEDSLGFGGLARGSIERGESLTPEEALLKTGTSADDIAAFRKNVGELPGEKPENPELLGVMKEIKTIIEKAWAS